MPTVRLVSLAAVLPKRYKLLTPDPNPSHSLLGRRCQRSQFVRGAGHRCPDRTLTHLSPSALILEYLELNLYETVVTTYDNNAFEQAGFTANDRSTFKQIINQEKQHIAFLQDNVRMRTSPSIDPI